MSSTAVQSSLLTLLRTASAGLGGLVAGLGVAGPLLLVPALFTAPLSSRSRLHLWSRLHHEQSQLFALLLPLLTISLALCAVLAHSSGPIVISGAMSTWTSVKALVSQNRKSLFTIAAVSTLAIRPYTFGLLSPRVELLKTEERRLLLERERSGARTALGLGKWRGGSPAESVAGGEETDMEDNGIEEEEEGEGGEGTVTEKIDSDALIQELSRLQLGTVVLSLSSFFLTLLELVCV